MTTRKARPTAGDFTFAGATAPHRTPEGADEPEESSRPAPTPAPTPAPAVSYAPDSASELASLLAESGETDTMPSATGGLSVPLGAFLAGRPDPELDLVNAGARVQRYLLDAAKTQAMLQSRGGHRVTVQDLFAQGLRLVLAPEIVQESFRQHGGQA